MKHTSEILVVANRTALSSDLEQALRARLASGPARFTLLVPMGRSSGADWIAGHMTTSLREVGLDVQGVAGDADPLQAVLEVWHPGRFDEIIVSTLPAATSRWMVAGLPRQIERHTGALVSHVETGVKARPARAETAAAAR
jgi:hypothetical protein